jgi:hypothetical protein
MDKQRVTQLMEHIVECGVGYQMAEFNLALALTIGAYIVHMHGDDIERALELHINNVRNICHHIDAHRGEPLDIGDAFAL